MSSELTALELVDLLSPEMLDASSVFSGNTVPYPVILVRLSCFKCASCHWGFELQPANQMVLVAAEGCLIHAAHYSLPDNTETLEKALMKA